MSTGERYHDQENDETDGEVEAANELRKSAERLVVHDDGPNANLFDTAKFDQCYRIAKAMSLMSILPDHLKVKGPQGKQQYLTQDEIAANCFRIVNQAVRWGFDPYAIIDETYVVSGKLGYSGKLIAAVVNTRAQGLEGRLGYDHTGSGDDMEVAVSGKIDGKVKTIKLCVRDAKTSNAMWKKDPEQKLCYSGATKWARRHCPEVMLGVSTDDDLDRIVESENQRVSTYDGLTKAQEDRQVGSLGEILSEFEVSVLNAQLAECESTTAVKAVRDIFRELTKTDDEREYLDGACVARENEIGNQREEKSNATT